ncbi:hypothetical protein K0M31_014090 [Melipona bicolor]|uniref:Uncharacterized protein n=1 Tax=Melipona bicolor TaxID=60889 RepID=A0AA40G919_9HYME|nr:hypothetical protein K0M31_014090 [Melipona bicolor]
MEVGWHLVQVDGRGDISKRLGSGKLPSDYIRLRTNCLYLLLTLDGIYSTYPTTEIILSKKTIFRVKPFYYKKMSRQCGNHDYEDSIFGRQQLEDIIRNIPPNHIITRYDCPCGHYTRYFALHQHVMLQMLGARCPSNDELREEARMYLRLLEDLELRNEQDETKQGSDNDDENHYYEIDR